MKPLRALRTRTRVFIDANILALAALSDDPLGDRCRAFLYRVQRGELSGCTATMTVAEVTHRVMVNEVRAERGGSAQEVIAYLQQRPDVVQGLKQHFTIASDIADWGVDILPLTVRDLHGAKDVRRQSGLLTNDSLIVAVMRSHKLRHLATHDRGFRRATGLSLWMPGLE